MSSTPGQGRPSSPDGAAGLSFVYEKGGPLLEWNAAVERLSGYDGATLRSMAPTELFEGEDFGRLADAVDELFDADSATIETTLVTAQGARIPVECEVRRVEDRDGTAVFEGSARDLRGQPDRQDSLERRARVLRELYEIIADRDRSFDAKVDAMLALGRAELDVEYGSLSEIRGDEYIFEAVAADDDSIQAGDVVPTAATNCEIVASTEESLVLGDVAADAPGETNRAGYTDWGISCYLGTPVFVDDSVYGTFCFYDREARSEAFTDWEVTLVDLMGRWVSYELDREQRTERLARQNEQLDQFASFVSHDLRNPLNAMDGWLEMAQDRGTAEDFERCRRSVDRMRTLIDDLLTLARNGTVIEDPEPVALAAVATESWRELSTENATLNVRTDLTIEGDERRLRQLFENLFRNSVEHGSTGSRTDSDDSVEHSPTGSRTKSGDSVEHSSTSSRAGPDDSVDHDGLGVTVTVGTHEAGFFVADDGPGIPPSERDQVFESGYTTAKSGTGFGLAIVQEVADAHGFAVHVTDSEDGGARFVFTERDGPE